MVAEPDAVPGAVSGARTPLTERWGLRFADGRVEADYREWRVDYVAPFTRFALYAATSAAATAWIAVAAGGLVELRGLTLVLLPALVVGMVLGANAARDRRHASRLRWWAIAINLAGGFMAVLLTMPLERFFVTASCATIAAYFALTMFRLVPLDAALAACSYLIVLPVLAIWWFREGILDELEFVLALFVPITTLLTGMILNLTIERLTRMTYVDHSVIELQRRELFEEHSRMSRFLSPQLAAAIHDHGLEAVVRTEMHSLTAVCIDLRGFTRYTQLHGAEQMAVVLHDYYAVVDTTAAAHGATVKDFAGDGAMILVGAPVRVANHTRIGLNLARELLTAVRVVTDRHSHPQSPLGVGIGIASGECAVGPIGSTEHLEYTAVGTAVNLCSRLCNVAKDGQVLMGPGTARALEEDPSWRREVMDLQGIPEPVEVTIEERDPLRA